MNNEQLKFIECCKNRVKERYSGLKEIIIYGAGSYGKAMIRAFEELGMKSNIIAVCDGNKEKYGQSILGIKISNILDVIKTYKNSVVVICSDYENDIRKDLERLNLNIFKRTEIDKFVEMVLTVYEYKTTKMSDICPFKWIGNSYEEKTINTLLNLLYDEESKIILGKRLDFFRTGELRYLEEMNITKGYFPREFFNMTENETFVDCGAYDGDSIEEFIECVSDKYNKIIAFEPDEKNLQKLENRKFCNDRISIYKAGVGKEEGVARFQSNGADGSLLSETGDTEIEIKKIDDTVEDATFIKMDIEGAEYDALIGAKNLIKRCHPKLAICIYHKFEDMREIPLFLKELVPEYKFIIRQNEHSWSETVLYAKV